MTSTFEFDPSQVLGVPPDAALDAIREAYRAQVKKHHPDHGGDSWAFMLVTQSYELLSRARVANRLAAEERRTGRTEPARAAPHDDSEDVRAGLRDAVGDPGLLVDVEMLLLRLELKNPYDLISLSSTDRNLSCSLNVSWPSSSADRAARPARDDLAATVAEAFDAARAATGPDESNHRIDEASFRGWLTYPSARRTSEGLHALHDALRERGLGLRQRTREVLIPCGSG